MSFREYLNEGLIKKVDPIKMMKSWEKNPNRVIKDLKEYDWRNLSSVVKYAEYFSQMEKHIEKFPERAKIYDIILKESPKLLSKAKAKFEKEQKLEKTKALINAQETTSPEDWKNFENKLKSHDWKFMYSDDSKTYNKGRESSKEIQNIYKQLQLADKKAAIAMYKKYKR